jgi:phosphoglycerate dehydrogenase-like enzyme
MRLGLVGQLPDAYARRLLERFPQVEIAEADGTLDAVLFWGRPLERVVEIVSGQPDLGWVHQRAAGVQPKLLEALRGHPTLLTRGSGAQGPAIGEYVAAAVLAFYKNLPGLFRLQQRCAWADDFAFRELAGQTVGILGLGSAGTSTARVLRGFGVHLRGLRRTGAPAAEVDRVYVPSELGEFLDGLNVLVIAAPLTAATERLIGAAELASLRPGALLVNVGRGPIVDELAMLAALESGQLGGAALDVFDAEPLPPESPLWRMPNVIISPHCADSTPESPERSLDIFMDNLARFLRGEALLNVVNREEGY